MTRLTRRRWLGWWAAGVSGLPALVRAEELRAPAFRVGKDGWGEASAEEVLPVLRLAAAQLWPYFPGRRIEKFVVLRGHEGPITHYQRDVLGEIVMKLDTGNRYWSQFVYQFSHEFCHILCGFDDDWKGNNWFEETLCEVASLFVLRRMTQVWDATPPWPNLKSYAPRFSEYADAVMRSRALVGAARLDQFYRKHAAELRRNPVNRELNGAMAAVLLGIFEAAPERWEAVTWLNSRPSRQGETFEEYLNAWRQAVPVRCRSTVEELMRRFGVAESGAL